MTEPRGYSSPAAFRRALTDNLKSLAEAGPWGLEQLQRQMAYDRLLERLYRTDEGWVVKGATALLAREIGVRGTIDIDVYREVSREVAEADLRRAVALDIGDWFQFELRAPQVVATGVRFPVTALVGNTPWAQFHDLVGSDLRMTGTPEDMPALARVVMPDVTQHGYRVYPLVDHVADKVVATFARYGSIDAPSTRYKDLVDLVAIATSSSVGADEQRAALISEFARREITMPRRFAVPDRPLWEHGYSAEARRSLLPVAHTLDEAVAVVSALIDPVLEGVAVA